MKREKVWLVTLPLRRRVHLYPPPRCIRSVALQLLSAATQARGAVVRTYHRCPLSSRPAPLKATTQEPPAKATDSFVTYRPPALKDDGQTRRTTCWLLHLPRAKAVRESSPSALGGRKEKKLSALEAFRLFLFSRTTLERRVSMCAGCPVLLCFSCVIIAFA